MDFSAAVRVVQGLSSHQFHRLNAATKVLINKKLDVSFPKVFSLQSIHALHTATVALSASSQAHS
jgi:hypothetical protein